jgi:hypothetical protein
VLAVYPEGDEEILNAQLAFYAAAARHSLPQFFAGVDEIVLTIVQPASIDPDAEMVSSVAVTRTLIDLQKTIASLSTKLRLGPQARYLPRDRRESKAVREADAAIRRGRRPWELPIRPEADDADNADEPKFS